MRIAVWDEPALDFFARAATELAEHHQSVVLRLPRRPLRDQLVSGQVDVALLPTLTVYLDHELFDVLPAVALSSWEFPFLKLNLKQGLSEPPAAIWIDPGLAQEALMTKVVLKEHYGMSPAFQPFSGDPTAVQAREDVQGTLMLTDSPVPASTEGTYIDLGQDWYELTHYPMVWGLFAMRNGEATGKAVNMLRDIASYAELHRDKWLVEQKTPKALFPFFTRGLRYRLDDLATASLTAFQDYLYYNDAVDEMAPLPFFQIPESEAEDEDEPLL